MDIRLVNSESGISIVFSEPNARSEMLSFASNGDEVEILGKVGIFYLVNYRGVEGYMLIDRLLGPQRDGQDLSEDVAEIEELGDADTDTLEPVEPPDRTGLLLAGAAVIIVGLVATRMLK